MLSALPVELIEHILFFLDANDRKTRAAVCRVNRLMYEVGTPWLYRSIGVYDKFSEEERLRRLQLLICTLSRNLPLTQHVEEIIHYIGADCTQEWPIVMDIELHTLQDLLGRDLGLHFNVFDYLCITDGHISEECCLLTLLAICPNAETLSLSGELGELKNWQGLSHIVSEITNIDDHETQGVADGTTSSGGTSFHTIKNVQLECSGAGELHADMKDLEYLLWLPALRRLRIDAFDHVSSPAHYHSSPPFESRVETIEIENCFAKGEDFEDLFSMCPALKSLTIEWPSREDNYRRFDWAHLGNSIRKNCSNLQMLCLDHPRDFMLDDDDFRNMMGDMNDEYLQSCHLPGLGSMRSLQHLQSLQVSSIALFGTHRDDSFLPADYSDSDDENEVKHCLEIVTPESLKELVVLCEHQGLSRADIAILHEPGADRLEQLTVMDCQKDEWISRKHGQLTASTPKLLERA